MNATFPKSKAQINREKYAAKSARADLVNNAMKMTAAHFRSLGCKVTRRPIVGSQEWAETRGDDLGASSDY